MENEILQVSQLCELINQTLDYAYPVVVVEGEVASFKINQNKWVFFDIKDDSSTLPCFMSIHQLKTPLEDGMKVRLHCSPKLTAWGKFSLTIRSYELAGEGTAKKAFELLRAQFEREGLFAHERKRLLPDYPAKIALITSAQAAAYNDFVTILNDRWAGVEIDHLQVQVQGESAPDQIVRAIEYCNQAADSYDVLVMIRGGGSQEDLQAFNTEPVTRAVYASKIPTLVGIGHEDDISLAELVADLRAATPSDAARLLVPDKTEVLASIGGQITSMESSLRAVLRDHSDQLAGFEHGIVYILHEVGSRVAELEARLEARALQRLAAARLRFESINQTLIALDPQAVLKRGYSIVRSERGAIRSSGDVQVGEKLMIQLSQGRLGAKVTSKE